MYVITYVVCDLSIQLSGNVSSLYFFVVMSDRKSIIMGGSGFNNRRSKVLRFIAKDSCSVTIFD